MKQTSFSRFATGSLFLIAVAIAMAFAVHLARNETAPVLRNAQSVTPSDSSRHAAAPQIQDQAPVTATQAVPAAIMVPRSTGLLDAFNAMRSGRVFAFDAWQRPKEGGQFYAAKVVDFCAGIWQTTDIMQTPGVQFDSNLSPIEQDRKAAAFDAIKARCADFVKDDFDTMSARRLLASQNAGGDPLLSAVSAFGVVVDRHQAVKALLATGDPLAIDDVGSRFAMHADKNAGPSIWFQGESHPASRTPELMAAFYLLPCSLGMRCDAGDPQLQLQCAVGGACYSNRFDRALREMAGGDAAKYAEIVRWQGVIADAVKRKDFTAFDGPK